MCLFNSWLLLYLKSKLLFVCFPFFIAMEIGSMKYEGSTINLKSEMYPRNKERSGKPAV